MLAANFDEGKQQSQRQDASNGATKVLEVVKHAMFAGSSLHPSCFCWFSSCTCLSFMHEHTVKSCHCMMNYGCESVLESVRRSIALLWDVQSHLYGRVENQWNMHAH